MRFLLLSVQLKLQLRNLLLADLLNVEAFARPFVLVLIPLDITLPKSHCARSDDYLGVDTLQTLTDRIAQ